MDPYNIRILEEGDDPVPIIKILFALAARTPRVGVTRREPDPSRYNTLVYEIWCAGIPSDFLGPVLPNPVASRKALLQASYGWEDIYRGKNSNLKRSMNPGAATHDGHWVNWVKNK